MAIYKVSFAKGTEAWYALSPAERKKVMDDSASVLERCAGKTIIALDTEWDCEDWSWIIVTEFPDVEAVRKQRVLSYELPSTRYLQSKSYLGTIAEDRKTFFEKGI